MIETPLVHLALAAWPVIAWATTAIQVSGLWWLIGEMRGVRVDAIRKDRVERIERTDALRANVVLVLKDGRRMRLSIDDVDGFEAAIRR